MVYIEAEELIDEHPFHIGETSRLFCQPEFAVVGFEFTRDQEPVLRVVRVFDYIIDEQEYESLTQRPWDWLDLEKKFP